jgi:hypothetical protein
MYKNLIRQNIINFLLPIILLFAVFFAVNSFTQKAENFLISISLIAISFFLAKIKNSKKDIISELNIKKIFLALFVVFIFYLMLVFMIISGFVS